ncbi:MAG: inositol monophosphatase [Alteromonadaceae bacterium]|nr:MAG: inositol monophosphatase [Alteromonadaceae bacterium]
MPILDKNQKYALYQLAKKAAISAGEFIANYDRSQINISHKPNNSLASQVLTEVDTLSQELILKHLLPSCNEYKLGLLSEELDEKENTGAGSRFERDFSWCIDPLDGTLPFTEGRDGYSVSIALVSREGIPQLGVIYNPVSGRLYHSLTGEGAFINDTPVSTLAWPSTPTPLTWVSDRSFQSHPNYPLIEEKMAALAHELGLSWVQKIEHGGAAMNACWVIENAPACYFKPPKEQRGGGSVWDFAASASLFNNTFNNTDAWVSDMQGIPLNLNNAETTFMNNDGILYASHERIAKAILQMTDLW